jgi:hypothetical protein
MITNDDTRKLVTDLKPAMLDRLAEEGYSRQRHDDLARILAITPGSALAGNRRIPLRRGGRVLALGITAAGVAAAVTAALVMPSAPSPQHREITSPVITLTAAQRVLYRLSSAAATAPQAKGRYIELTELDSGPALGDAQNQQNLRKDLAIMKKVPALRKVYRATLKKLAEMPATETFTRISVIDSQTGTTWTYQHGSGVPSELPVAQHASPTRAEFATWPTSVSALRALLVSQARSYVAEYPKASGQTTDELVYQEAFNWLSNPLISPELRSALYKVLAQTPGAVVKAGTTDRLGRPAVEISWYDRGTKEESATFENPGTGTVLQSVFDNETTVYESITGHAALPPDPYGN